MREICEQLLEENPQQLECLNENGEPIVVEIDESKYFHRKYHRGHRWQANWVFGPIERHSGCGCLVGVPDERRETLPPIIKQWILPGSRIISNGGTSYADIPQISCGIYIHDIIVQQKNFVDSNDPTVHTPLIENSWMREKRKLRHQHGSSGQLFQSDTAEFQWRQIVGENKYGENKYGENKYGENKYGENKY